MLLEVAREYESYRGEIPNIFAKKKGSTAESAWRGYTQFARADEARKSRNRPAIKMQGTNRSGYGRREACYVTPDLCYG